MNTARPKEAENPSTEQDRARYLGKVAVYPFCVSSVAMPSSSSYNLKISVVALLLALSVALLKSLRKVGREVKNTSIKAVKPTTAEGLGEGSIKSNEMRKRPGSGENTEHEILFQSKDSMRLLCKEPIKMSKKPLLL